MSVGPQLADWAQHQPVLPQRLWRSVANEFYLRCRELPAAANYLSGTDGDELHRRFTGALPLVACGDLRPTDLIYLHRVHLAARRIDRPLDAGAYDALATALVDALVENGVPGAVSRPLRAELDRARPLVLSPEHPCLRGAVPTR